MIQELCFCLALQPGWEPWRSFGLQRSGTHQRCCKQDEIEFDPAINSSKHECADDLCQPSRAV